MVIRFAMTPLSSFTDQKLFPLLKQGRRDAFLEIYEATERFTFVCI
jgi:hypothetical protein